MSKAPMVGFRVDEELHDMLESFAAANGLTLSSAVKLLVQRGLGLAKPSAAAAYNDGLRQGLHEARVRLRAALNDAWRSEGQ